MSAKGAELVLPRRFLVPYLTVLAGDQFKVLFAVTCQWRLSDSPISFRVRPQDIGPLCDLSIGEVHQILNQLAQIGYMEARMDEGPQARRRHPRSSGTFSHRS
jgi:hypothetical protein